MGRLLLLFALLPFVELYVLVRIGQRIGFLPTLLGILVVGAVGAALARHEGVRVVRAWQRALAEGRVPEEGVLSGALVFVGGLLLVMPGIVSDVLGLALLLPPVRKLVAIFVRRRLEQGIASGSIHVVDIGGGMGGPFGSGGFEPRDPMGGFRPPDRMGSRGRASAGSVIDVEGEDVTKPPLRLQ